MSDIDADASAYTIAAYLRVASLAVSLYDYLETLPTAWKFYKEHYRTRRISLSAVLFVLIRSTSILVLTISNVGFFYMHFTEETCRNFYLLPPTLKVLQAMVSQAILGIRAWNLSRRSRIVCYLLLCLFTVSTVLQWVTSIHQRIPKLGKPQFNCKASNPKSELGAWTYYAIAVIYDSATTTISIAYLLKYKLTSNSSMMSKLTRMMLYDGIGYFVVLTAVNVLNLILFQGHRPDIQTAGSSLAYCVSWIMSQRLLIHLYDASRQHRNESINEAITITQNLESARDVTHAIRSQFEQKSNGFELTVPDFDLSTHHGISEEGHGVESVHVRIEHTVKLDRRLRTFELENYSRTGRHSRDTQSRS